QAIASAVLSCGAVLAAGCSRDTAAMTPERVEKQYGVADARKGEGTTENGSVRGTLVPVTLDDGRRAQLVIPESRRDQPHAVYLHDDQGLHPVEVSRDADREQVRRSPHIVGRHAEREHPNKRSWEREALIIGGSAGSGAAIGALAGGGKGAGVG